jgi:circadian clock protein KaiB
MKPTVRLRLYVTGNSIRSERAVQKIRGLGIVDSPQCTVEVIDALERPDLAERDRVIATPTLIRLLPKPEIRIVGDLNGKELIRETLELSVETPEEPMSKEDMHG